MQTSSTAYVLFDNLLSDNSLSASSTAAGSHAQNSIDWRTTTYWTPDDTGEQFLQVDFNSAVIADSFALYRHNCGSSGAVVTVQAWSGAAWIDRVTLTDLIDDQCIFIKFSATGATKWRVLFDITSALAVGVVMIGQSVLMPFGMPVGFTPPRHNRKTDIINQRTESGQFAGRSIIRRGTECELIQNQVKPDWLRDYGERFIRHAEKLPFVFSWSYIKYPQDAVYCVANNIMQQPYKDHGWQSLKMSLECLP